MFTASEKVIDLAIGWKPGLGGTDCITMAGEDTIERGGAGRAGVAKDRCGGDTMTFLKVFLLVRSLLRQ